MLQFALWHATEQLVFHQAVPPAQAWPSRAEIGQNVMATPSAVSHVRLSPRSRTLCTLKATSVWKALK